MDVSFLDYVQRIDFIKTIYIKPNQRGNMAGYFLWKNIY